MAVVNVDKGCGGVLQVGPGFVDVVDAAAEGVVGVNKVSCLARGIVDIGVGGGGVGDNTAVCGGVLQVNLGSMGVDGAEGDRGFNQISPGDGCL